MGIKQIFSDDLSYIKKDGRLEKVYIFQGPITRKIDNTKVLNVNGYR